MKPIKVVIVDDVQEIIDYFIYEFNKTGEIEVIGFANTGKDGVKVVLEKKPDVVIMDVEMETSRAGIQAIRQLKEANSTSKIIVVTIHGDDKTLFEAYGAGAIDYINKTVSIDKVMNTIISVYNNTFQMPNEVVNKIAGEIIKIKAEQESFLYTLNLVSKLTRSEFNIIRMIREGCTKKQIAKLRFVEEVTIRSQITRILSKFNMNRMKEVVELLENFNVFDIYDDEK